MVDVAPEAEVYCTDGYNGYLDVVFPGKHIFNVHNKNDTFTVEGVNADLRHYIPTLARRSRCFPPKAEESPGGPRCLLFMLIIVLAVRRIATAPAILGPLFPLSLFDFF